MTKKRVNMYGSRPTMPIASTSAKAGIEMRSVAAAGSLPQGILQQASPVAMAPRATAAMAGLLVPAGCDSGTVRRPSAPDARNSSAATLPASTGDSGRNRSSQRTPCPPVMGSFALFRIPAVGIGEQAGLLHLAGIDRFHRDR